MTQSTTRPRVSKFAVILVILAIVAVGLAYFAITAPKPTPESIAGSKREASYSVLCWDLEVLPMLATWDLLKSDGTDEWGYVVHYDNAQPRKAGAEPYRFSASCEIRRLEDVVPLTEDLDYSMPLPGPVINADDSIKPARHNFALVGISPLAAMNTNPDTARIKYPLDSKSLYLYIIEMQEFVKDYPVTAHCVENPDSSSGIPEPTCILY